MFGRRVEHDRFNANPVGTQALGDGGRVDEELTRAGIGDDEAHLIGGLGGVNRHRHAACKKDAEVREDPVDAVGRQQRDAVTGREPARAQGRSDRRNTG